MIDQPSSPGAPFSILRRNKTVTTTAVAALACWSLLASGCNDSLNPFSREIYLQKDVPESHLRDINSLDLNQFQEPEKAKVSSREWTPDNETPPDPPEKLELTIDECRALALKNNLELKVEFISPTITRETVTEAESAFEALFTGTANYSKTNTPTASTLAGSKTEDLNTSFGVNIPLRTGGNLSFNLPVDRFETDNSFSTLNPAYSADFAISISQPLLRNAGVRTNTHAIRIAHYQTQVSEAQTKLAVIRVLATADRAYWRLYANRRALEVRKGEYDLAMAQLERAKRLVKAGTAPEVEVTRAQSGVAQRLENIIIAENAVRDSQRDLKRIMNIPEIDMASATTIVPMTEPNPVEFNLDGRKLAANALGNRMELLELEIQIAQDASTIDVRRNQILPLVNLDYTYNINGLGASLDDAFDVLGNRGFEDHRFALRVEVPIGNQGALSRLRQALLTRLRTLASRQNRISFIRQEIFNAVDQIEANWQRILAARQNAILAARTLAAEERQFGLGLRTSTDVLDAQTSLADAQLSEIRALTEYEISQIDLGVASGMTLGADKIRWEPAQNVQD